MVGLFFFSLNHAHFSYPFYYTTESTYPSCCCKT
nr:MAG TPA: hypothetical protein [Caudoviricetes sp.]